MQKRAKHITVLLVVIAACAALIVHDQYPQRVRAKLTSSIQQGDLHGVESALAFRANPNAVVNPADGVNIAPKQTVLTFAAMKESAPIVAAVLKAGARVNDADPAGRTPLVAAIDFRHEKTAEILLDAGADVNMRGTSLADNKIKESPIEAVVSRMHSPKVYQMLLERGVKPTLQQAIVLEDIPTIKSLIAGGADPNGAVDSGSAGSGKRGQSILTFAAATSTPAIVTELIRAGAKAVQPDSTGSTPLMAAISRHDAVIVDTLLTAGADPRKPEVRNGNTVTPMAAVTAALGNARRSRAASYRIYNILRKRGVTPDLIQAVQAGDTDQVKSIIQAGANVNSLDTGGMTPLLAAVYIDDEDTASILLNAGADPNRPGFYKVSATKRMEERPIDVLATTSLYVPASGNNQVEYKHRLECCRRFYALLRKHGATPNVTQAVALGDTRTAADLIAKGTDLNTEVGTYSSALAVAVQMNDKTIVSQLLAAGADAKRGDSRHMSAIQVASTKHDKSMLQLLKQ